MASTANESSKKRKKASTDDASPSTTKTASSTVTSSHNKTEEKQKETKPKTKKKKINGKASAIASASAASLASESSSSFNFDTFKPYDLSTIQEKIKNLAYRVPEVPEEGLDPYDKAKVKDWAMSMQAIIEEFNLLLTCVAAATYRWGSDRTGAADQNLSLLSSELGNSQEQISSSVAQRLTNVLAPVVEIATKETIVKKERDEKTGEIYERRINSFTREENDPGFIHLCYVVLCRNASMLRHVVLTNFHKVGKCFQDYSKATKKDGNQSRSAGFY